MLSSQKVLVVGAGPVGMAAALFMNKLGVKLRIIQKNTQFSDYSKALGVNARSMDLLNSVGATERLAKEGLKARQAHIYYDEKLVIANKFADVKIPGNLYPYMTILPQSHTQAIFRDLLKEKNIKLETGTALTDITSNMSKVLVKMSKDGQAPVEQVFDYVFAADGAKSIVRRRLEIPFDGETFKPEMYLSDYELLNPSPLPAAQLHLWKDHSLAIIQVTKDVIRLVANTEDYLSCVPSRFKLGKEVWKSNFHVNHRLAKVFQQGRTFLAGDAAHIHSPVGGRGMNIGIEDAFVFTKLLSIDRTEMYNDLRRPVLEHLVKRISQANTMFLGKGDSQMKQKLPYILPTLRFLNKRDINKFILGLDHEIGI